MQNADCQQDLRECSSLKDWSQTTGATQHDMTKEPKP